MANPYGNVEARYLSPRKVGTPTPIPAKEKIPESQAYSNVEPRYLTPRHASPLKQTEVPKSIFDSSSHEMLGKRIYRGVTSKFIDPGMFAPNEASPRRKLEEQRQANKRLYMWRNDTVAASRTTFDDHMKLTKKRMDTLPFPKKNFKAPSMVKDYVTNGTPIRHYTTMHLLEEHASKKDGGGGGGSTGAGGVARGQSPGGGGNAGGGSPARNGGSRAQSPTTGRSESPGRRWTNAGWQNQAFDDRISEHSAARESFSREQERVRKDLERRQTAVVGKNHVPRVAQLSTAARILRQQQTTLRHQEGTGAALFPPDQSFNLDGEA